METVAVSGGSWAKELAPLNQRQSIYLEKKGGRRGRPLQELCNWCLLSFNHFKIDSQIIKK